MVWKIFVPRHASRAMQHLLKIKTGDIAICKAFIPPSYLARYKALYESGQVWMVTKKHASQCIEESVAMQQDVAVGNLLKKHGIAVSDLAVPLSTVATMSVASARGSRQKSFALSSSSQRTLSIMNMDIRKSNNAAVEMAIVDFFHCENIPDSVVESPRFIWLVCLCRLAGDDFVVPYQKKIGGELLDLNYDSIYNQNKAELLKSHRYLGWHFLVMVPLSIEWFLNILSMSGTTPPMTVSIQDCTKHLAEGGKKDAYM